MISVHLRQGASEKPHRKHELATIGNWVGANNQHEKDFIILGDMNIENVTELQAGTPAGFHSLNDTCQPTNTQGMKPYDHVMVVPASTGNEIDAVYGFQVLNLITAMETFWTQSLPYPGKPNYDHDRFRAYYSDHNPVSFRMHSLPAGDDD